MRQWLALEKEMASFKGRLVEVRRFDLYTFEGKYQWEASSFPCMAIARAGLGLFWREQYQGSLVQAPESENESENESVKLTSAYCYKVLL